MKLKNKKTGEIREIKNILVDEMFSVNSLAKLNEEWEDYEDENYWYVDWAGVNGVLKSKNPLPLKDEFDKEIGNRFETEEEAEKALEKLKAWKRLKDKGFRFDGWKMDGTIWFETKQDEQEWSPKYCVDLDLLFGGEK